MAGERVGAGVGASVRAIKCSNRSERVFNPSAKRSILPSNLATASSVEVLSSVITAVKSSPLMVTLPPGGVVSSRLLFLDLMVGPIDCAETQARIAAAKIGVYIVESEFGCEFGCVCVCVLIMSHQQIDLN